MRTVSIVGLAAVVLLGLAACGGGGGGTTGAITGGGGTGGGTTGGGATGGSTGSTYTAGVFEPSSSFANQCATPRIGTDPSTGRRYPDTQGTALTEKNFLRSWTNELYLWYSEVADRDPASIADVLDYFDTLKTTAQVVPGVDKDRFHFTYDTAEYNALSSSGAELGYGISWALVDGYPTAPVGRQIYVQYVQAGTQAAQAGVKRGDRLVTVDNVDVLFGSDVDTLNAALFDPATGSVHTLVFRDRDDASLTHTLGLTAAQIDFDAVPTVTTLQTASGNVGYVLFNSHTYDSEAALKSAVEQLSAAQVSDLVLDLRYNGGGLLDVASELAYMIAGPTQTSGRAFNRIQFNDKYPTKNPVTGETLTPIPFWSTAQGFSVTAGTSLPSLSLSRIYVLTSADTCSASEAVINGLRGVGVAVYQIGGDTCGKPYGFYPQDNCGTTYFSIQLRSVNDAGFGDYAAGFSATRTDGDPLANLPGCTADDDYTHELGDPAEGQLQTALAYRQTGACPVAPQASRVRAQAAQRELSPEDAALVLHKAVLPWRDNMILRPRR